MKNLLFVLEDKKPVPAQSIEHWQSFYFVEENRLVAWDSIGDANISTVFTGTNSRYWGDGPPLVFETMIFGGVHDNKQWKCCTWEEAEEQHKKVVEMVKAALFFI
jgi:hypothetical protein